MKSEIDQGIRRLDPGRCAGRLHSSVRSQDTAFALGRIAQLDRALVSGESIDDRRGDRDAFITVFDNGLQATSPGPILTFRGSSHV